MCNIKTPTWLGSIVSFLATKLLQKSSKWEEEIIFFRVIITGLIQNLVNCFCGILRIPCAFPSCVAQLDKYLLPTIYPSSQPRYSRVENCYYKNTWTLQWLDDHGILIQQDTQILVWQHVCINSCINFI